MNIKEVIKAKGLTIEQVATRMGISRVGLSQHLNGNPSVDVLERIALAIGCNAGDFFDRSDAKPANEVICPKCGTTLEVKVKE